MQRVSFLVLTIALAACGGSEFEQASPGASGGNDSDASAGAGGSSGTSGSGASAGTAGTGGTGTGGTGTGGTAGTGTGGTSTGGTGGVEGGQGCADTCVPGVAPGFEGPFLVHEGVGTSPPPCDGAYGGEHAVWGVDPLNPPQACPCECMEASTPEPKAVVKRFFGLGCSDATCWEVTAGMNDCVALPALGCGPTAPSYRVDIAGMCAVDGPVGPMPWTWGGVARVCSPASVVESACGNPEALCVPNVPAAGSVCIVREGEWPCPQNGYTEQHVYYADAIDNRVCTPCACGPSVSGGVGKLHGYTDTGCNAAISGPGVDVPFDCQNILIGTAVSAVKFVSSATGTNPQCAPLELPNLLEGVEVQGPKTLCCLPPTN